jgi:cytochrome d ubiquinol oxidase subunit I
VFAKRSFTVALILAALAAVAAPISGDSSAGLVAREQPSKLAALEGLFETTEGATPITVFGVPDEEAQQLKYAIQIPAALSLLTYRDITTPVVGLDRFNPEDRPPVLIPFISFHLMVGIGSFLIVITLTALFLLWRGTLFEQRWLLWGFVFAIGLVYVGNQAGWVTAEVGRQPWIVQAQFEPVMAARENPEAFYKYHEMDFSTPVNGLRTQEAVSGAITGEMVLGSLVMFSVLYALLVLVWVFVLNTKIHAGPEEGDKPTPGDGKKPGFFAVAAEHADAAGPSLTEARRDEADGDDADD